jgi:hypothetical protein
LGGEYRSLSSSFAKQNIHLSNRHGVTCQKTWIFTNTTVGTANGNTVVQFWRF